MGAQSVIECLTSRGGEAIQGIRPQTEKVVLWITRPFLASTITLKDMTLEDWKRMSGLRACLKRISGETVLARSESLIAQLGIWVNDPTGD